MLELKSLQEEPVEGFRITLVAESDLYNWEVAIFGPPNTLYEGGYFKVCFYASLRAEQIHQQDQNKISSLIDRHVFQVDIKKDMPYAIKGQG